MTCNLCQFVHGEYRRQARRRFVPEVMKAKVCQKLAIGASISFSALFEVAFTRAGHSTLKSPRNGVAADLEHSPFIVAYTVTRGSNFGGILSFVEIVFQGLKDRDGPGRQRHVAGVSVFCGWQVRDSALEIHVLPSKRHYFPPTHSSFNSQPDNGGKQRRVAGCYNPLKLAILRTPL